MLHSVFLSVENIIINQIIFFYNIFQKYDYRNFYFFKYKNIRFAYFKMSKTLYIQTEVDKILGRNIITLKDKNEFLEKIKEIIKEFVNIADEKLKFNVCRCDYKVDLTLSDKEMENIFILLNKHRTTYKYIRSQRKYDTSISLSNHTGGTKINIYDKGVQSNLPEFKNMLRVELQIKNKKIHRFYKKNRIERDINLYWSREFMEEFYFKYFEDYFYKGDYYKLGIAKKIILDSPYKEIIKNRLIEFITRIQKDGFTITSKRYSYNTVKRYVEYLNNIKVNPITISNSSNIDKIENILYRIKKEANEKYFN